MMAFRRFDAIITSISTSLIIRNETDSVSIAAIVADGSLDTQVRIFHDVKEAYAASVILHLGIRGRSPIVAVFADFDNSGIVAETCSGE